MKPYTDETVLNPASFYMTDTRDGQYVPMSAKTVPMRWNPVGLPRDMSDVVVRHPP